MSPLEKSAPGPIGVCAWCGEGPEPGRPGQPVNFVVCRKCLERLLAAIPPRPRWSGPRRRRRRR